MSDQRPSAPLPEVPAGPDRTAVVTVVLGDGRELTPEAAGFAAGVSWMPPSGAGRHTVRLTVTYRGDRPRDAAVRFTAALPGEPHSPPWWMVPGVFYGENRPADCQRVFPRFAMAGADHGAMVSDHWEFRADRAATPAVLGWSGPGGVALLADETTELGMTGLGFGHDPPTGRSHVQLTFPFREAPVSYDGSETAQPAESARYTWQPGRQVTLEFAVQRLDADRHGYAAVLRAEHERLARTAELRPWVDIPHAAELAAAGLHRWHYAEPGVLLETVAFDRGISGQDGLPVDRQAMHVGWISGIPWAYALLTHARRVGAADQSAAARRVIDFVCAELAPCGTFWGTWYRGRGWSGSWSPVPHTLHSRTLAEATQFLLRALELGADLREAHPSWAAAVRSNLDAVVARQRSDGALGASHHALTGEVLSWSGCAGLAWVGALAEAGRLDGPDGADGAYLAAAVRAGDHYAGAVRDELLHGAPEDVDLAPSSEDGYVAVMAYLALYRRTGETRWCDLARRAADWTLTFRYAYNTAFPPGTVLETYRFATRGADNASPANQHLHAYGLICTAEFGQLSSACGDPYYAARAREALACFRQFVARFDGDFNAYRGMVSERYYQTACFQPKGMLLTLSHAWSAGVLLLACEQALADPALCLPAA
ncbi:hypothetical protein [Mangrovihabitans endophyticus]|uniref:Uncharacterized protein n=1 Tax=Mangrovihabitans endophyticus TaxID=1751298 RepID=A0A8J3BW27_9ACTN|nr:hypothetical protein [Mangrovihabitans endophyticus]GGK75025.1 hypothetical protein GCM10012284_06280 [Mangrovihabitans endophyticus]